jgi:hypothetical protein
MGTIIYIAWLFLMAIACLALAAMKLSLAWLSGGVLLLAVAIYALRLAGRDQDSEREGVSIGFFGVAMSLMLGGILGIFLLTR